MHATSTQDTSASKARARQKENNIIYSYPLPLLFSPPPPKITWAERMGLPSLKPITIGNPQCEGYFDSCTQSVWVINLEHAMILWRRGFFGKGSLSRSEPSWLARCIHDQQQKAQNALTAEEIRANRRAERQQFKLARAQAFAASVVEAEAAFAAGDTSVKIAPLTREEVAKFMARTADIPGANTPDTINIEVSEIVNNAAEIEGASIPDENIPENLEHLQLTLPEAFFLLWSLDCLHVLDQNTQKVMSLSDIWRAFQQAHIASAFASATNMLRFDNPFLVSYVLYHHYRSLGWVVRGGIKFCVDYLLYKRGPAFHHAEFAVMLCPAYEDEEDRWSSPFNLANSKPFSWSWLSTINRVNTQVQKTLILAYVTIPSSKRICSSLLSSPACLAHYSIREVVLRRFVPARMRD